MNAAVSAAPDIATVDTVTLYYRAGSSDKVYRADIVPAGDDLYNVSFAFGRRGTTLQTGTKTSAPVPYAQARAVFERLVREKTAKGYTPGEDGTPYQQTPAEHRSTGIQCQLLNPIEERVLPVLLNSDRIAMQEKFDGRRLLLRKQGDSVVGINRLGLETGLPLSLIDAGTLIPGDCVLDGEAVGDVLHVFDLLQAGDADLRPKPYSERLATLTRLLAPVSSDGLRLVPTAFTPAEKCALFDRLKAEGKEGVVFKVLDAPYTAGRPNSGGNQLKFKFCETASCLVTGQNEKRSVSLGLVSGGRITPCGNVTIPPDRPVPSPGERVEVRYLYAFPQSNVLYQPVYLGVRRDIPTEDCTPDQLKYKAA